MRRYLYTAVLLLASAVGAYAQPINQTARRTASAAALPATCSSSAGVKDMLWQNGVGWSVCTALNTWTAVGVGTVTGSTGATDNAILRADGTGGAALQTSTAIISDTGTITVGDGGVNPAAFGFVSEPTLGLFRRGAGQLGVSANTTIGWFDSTGYHGFGTIVEAFNSIGAVSTDGLVADSNGSAAAGAQQWSPRLRFTGSGWKTDAVAAAQAVDWIVENQPVQGTAAPSSNLVFSSQINAGGYTSRLTLASSGNITGATFDTTGTVGIGTTHSATAGQMLTVQNNNNNNTTVRVGNTDAVDTSANAGFTAAADNAIVSLVGQGTARSVSRGGVTIGGWAELIASSGNGLLIGTSGSAPVRIYTGGTAAMIADTSQGVTFPGAIIPSQTIGITGTTTNNNANAGAFGEYQTGTVAANTTSLSTGTTANVGTNTNITLAAGDWDCSGVVNFTFGATTSITNLTGGISTTTGTLPAQDSYFDYETSAMIPTGTAVATWVVPTVRLSNSGSTNVFLVSQATFTASTLKVGGTIRCRRMR